MRNRQRLLTDEQWESIEPLFPKPRRRKTILADHERPIDRVWKASCRFCRRGGMAISACRIPLALDMLASAQAMGRTGRMVARLESIVGNFGCRRATAMGRGVPGWELRSRQKGDAAVGKTKRGKGTKWMVLEAVKVLRREFGWKCLSGRSYV